MRGNRRSIMWGAALCIAFSLFSAAMRLYGQHLQLSGGFALPNDGITSFFDRQNFTSGTTLLQAIQSATKSGFHVNARYLLDVNENTAVALSAGYNSFAQGKANVTAQNIPGGFDIAVDYSQNVIPIGVGIDYALVKSIIGIVLVGELNYNIINYSVNQQVSSVSIPVPIQFSDKSLSRVGFSAGVGLRFDAKLVNLTLDGRYHFANMIGRSEGELDRRFLTISVGILF